MVTVELTVNGRPVTAPVTPRTHLADMLRDTLGLTGTHLRCEQGVCGACTLLIDGEPARSCIMPAVACHGAEVVTIEGLDDDLVAAALRAAFTAEHGLQCGYCTPGMLVSARDIVTRLPDADERRIRLELSGNLCRCTGYTGIVRAVQRVLEQRRAGELAIEAARRDRLGPVGSGRAEASAPDRAVEKATDTSEEPRARETALGLGGARPNIEIVKSVTVARPLAEVWSFLADIEQVATCMPGARLDTPVSDPGHASGRLAVKLGPITASFAGECEIERDEASHSGRIKGAGRDRLSGSRTRAEVEYRLAPDPADRNHTTIELRLAALLTGALAQVSRTGIVDDLAERIIAEFSRNLERRMSGEEAPSAEDGAAGTLSIGALLLATLRARLRAVMRRLRKGAGS